MGRAYLLTGAKKVGKTTALQAIIDKIGLERCGGFYTEEIRTAGLRTAFRIVTLGGQSGVLADVNSNSPMRVGRINKHGVAKYGVELDELDSFGVQAIYKAIENKDFVIVDEIGPMQLFSVRFRQAILDAMNSHTPLLGTIVLPSHPWADRFKQREEIELYHFTFSNRDNLAKMLCWFFGQF